MPMRRTTAVKTVVERWKEAQPKTVMPLTPMPEFTPESIAKGKDLFIYAGLQQVSRPRWARWLVRRN